jgi:hypothetical protein
MENGVAVAFRLVMIWMAANAAVVVYLAVSYSADRLLWHWTRRTGWKAAVASPQRGGR